MLTLFVIISLLIFMIVWHGLHTVLGAYDKPLFTRQRKPVERPSRVLMGLAVGIVLILLKFVAS